MQNTENLNTNPAVKESDNEDESIMNREEKKDELSHTEEDAEELKVRKERTHRGSTTPNKDMIG